MHLDELKASQDDNTCRVIHKKCHYSCYHHDIKFHMIANTIFVQCPWTVTTAFYILIGWQMSDNPTSFYTKS